MGETGLPHGDGNVVDDGVIEARIRSLGGLYLVETVAVDPWNATQMIARLQADGLPCIPVQQTIGNLSSATKTLESLVLQGKLRHGGHPILKWCASNAVVQIDANENLRASKDKSPDRIDGISGIITGLSVALVRPQPTPWSFAEHVVLGPPRASMTNTSSRRETT